MPKRIPDEDLEAIVEIVRRHPEPVAVHRIMEALERKLPRRTLQHRLKRLVDTGRLIIEGEGSAAAYRASTETKSTPDRISTEKPTSFSIPLSEEAADIRRYLRRPTEMRAPVGYRRAFLDSYRPNVGFYLSPAERAHLRAVGTPNVAPQPAGTYAKHILNRLLIDLSWNSSRLEGNTYSLLDTRRLIEFGEVPEGRDHLEAQMILNHKEAIAFLVGAPDEIGFDRHTILNLHAILANNLLVDETAAGRLRYIAVGIERSVFHPLEVPQLVEECFDQILATATAIEDPFEQAFFVMVQLPYLQPFDDVNKRVSRLAANIPFIRANLTPLSFIDVPRDIYTDAILGVYELNRVDLLKDVFLWAYERSAARYAAVRQSLGNPDPFRLRHRDALRRIVGEVIRSRLGRKAAAARIAAWAEEIMPAADRAQAREIAEDELLGLHEGNYARYRVRPAEFAAWQEAWAVPPL